MPDSRSLDIAGYGGRPVPHTFFRQEGAAFHLGIVFPGYVYRAHMPLLYYPARMLLAKGADVLRVEYAYDLEAGLRALPEAEQYRRFYADVTAACRAALAQRDYRQVTLIGKSGGTLALGHLLTTEPALAQGRAIWLTPLLTNERLRAFIERCRQPSLFVIGTDDPEYDQARLIEAQAATRGQAVVVGGADHSLEIKGDVFKSLQALEQMLRAIQTFLA